MGGCAYAFVVTAWTLAHCLGDLALKALKVPIVAGHVVGLP